MKIKGIEIEYRNHPELDPAFAPLYLWEREFLKDAEEPIAISVERENGKRAVADTFIHGTKEKEEADLAFVERKIKTLLWAKGGFCVTIYGNAHIYEKVQKMYEKGGTRAFDSKTMGDVYEAPFTLKNLPYDQKPEERDSSVSVGGHTDGCRIGFDAGGSDRKVSAVIDGKVVYSEEVVWFPKLNANPDYQYAGILEAFRTAASKMPRVDAIGVSSAGIFVNNRTMLSSLFLKVSPEDFEAKVKDIYVRAAKEIGDVPILVANDGDVTALAGAMELGENAVLGIAMGTSEAAGYVNAEGNITGWLNELAFAPVDLNPDAMVDEWSGDAGCGVKYFSQDAVIKLAPAAGIELDPALSPAEKLKVVQALANEGKDNALAVFRSIGAYLAHTLPLYGEIYDLRHLLLLGRVTSGKGGEALLAEARRILAENYPDFACRIHLPDENSRRVGQSVAAAGLPALS